MERTGMEGEREGRELWHICKLTSQLLAPDQLHCYKEENLDDETSTMIHNVSSMYKSCLHSSWSAVNTGGVTETGEAANEAGRFTSEPADSGAGGFTSGSADSISLLASTSQLEIEIAFLLKGHTPVF